MKKMKKILAMALALAMVLGMSVTSFAAPGGDPVTGTASDKGSITVKGVDDGATVELYKILTPSYTLEGSKFSGEYTTTNEAYNTTINALNKNYTSINAEQINALGNALVGSAEYTTNTRTNGDYVFDSVDVGMYIVKITGIENKIYSYAVASVFYTGNGTADLPNGDEIANGTLELANPTITAKVSEHPSVDKTATNNNKTNVAAGTANIGDIITYTVDINPVPYYGGNNPVLNIVDTMGKGLEFQELTSVKVYNTEGNEEATLTQGTDYTFAQGTMARPAAAPAEGEDGYDDYVAKNASGAYSDQFKVDFKVNGAYTLNAYQGMKVTVTYTAKVTSDAEVNETANENEVILNFTKDSKVTGKEDTDDDITKTYTFDIDGDASVTGKLITKVGVDEYEKALPGAVFGVYTDEACTTAYKQNDVAVTTTSNNDGKLYIKGLAGGTYYIKETEAPSPYKLNPNAFEIKIEPTINDEGDLTSWTVTVKQVGTEGKGNKNTFTVDQADGSVTIKDLTFTSETTDQQLADNTNTTEIQNTTLSELPSTGGIGTTIFTIAGCAIMIVAAGLFFISRKKAAK